MKKKDDEKLYILYLCLHKKLCDTVDRSMIMERKKFLYILGVYYHIPKSLRIFILKEMERLKMIEDLGSMGSKQKTVRIKPIIIDPEEQKTLHKYYQELLD